MSWSHLVIATGAVPNDFGIPGVREHACSFRTLDDVQRVRRWIRDLRQRRSDEAAVVIAGAGPTGVELACKLADLLEGSARVHLVEAGDSILPGSAAFNREQAQAALQRREVVLHLNSAVSRVLPDRVELASGSEITHNGLLWTAGSQPNVPAIQPQPALERGRLVIGADLRLQSSEDLFAIGDVSIHSDCPWPATAQVAIQQADAVAKALEALRQSAQPEPFQFRNLGEMLSLGIGYATLTGLGITLAGTLAFQLRRAAYLTRLPGLSLGVRSAGAWLTSR
jgi:NADH dehydrogenase